MGESGERFPDLPGLESVSGGSWAWAGVYAFLGIILGAVPGLIAGLALRLAKSRPDNTERLLYDLLTAATIGAAAGLLVAAAVILKKDFVFKTSRDGLTARGIRRCRFLPWGEIMETSVRKRWTGEAVYVLTTERHTVILPPSEGISSAFAASVWQHLRRFGRQDDSFLTEEARSFWVPIPEEVPVELDWHNPSAPSWPLMGAAAIVVILLALVWHFREFIFDDGRLSGLFHAFSGAVGGGLAAFSRRLFTVSQCSVRTDYFEARTAVGPVFLEWEDVRAAGWARGGLSVRGAGLRTRADIPFTPADQQSVFVVLSILRRLRELPHIPPVAIPEPLRSSAWLRAAVDAAPSPDFVELRQPASIRIAIFTGMLLSAALLTGISFVSAMPIPPAARWALRFAAAVDALLGFVMLKGRSLRADTDGITYSHPFGSRFVRWSQIASYRVRQSRQSQDMIAFALTEPGQAPGPVTYTFRDCTGRVLLSFMPFGPEEDRQTLAAIIERRLASLKQEEPV